MSGGGLFFIAYFTLLFWILIFTYYYKKRISSMVGMLVSMVLGMTVGLSLGTLIGLLYPDHFFYASLISMLIGALIGVTAGFPISIMAVLDGLLSGIMGGMMGAMFGVMIPSEYINTTANLIGVISAGVIFILFLLIKEEVGLLSNKVQIHFFEKPLIFFLFVCFFLYSNNQLYLYPVGAEVDHAEHISIMEKPDQEITQITVDATDFKFPSGTISINKGEKVSLTLNNNGFVEHDFDIVGTDIHVHAEPGKDETIIFSLDKPGIYEAICTIPGHKESGMVTSVIVN